jgi:hypothetical protein
VDRLAEKHPLAPLQPSSYPHMGPLIPTFLHSFPPAWPL